MSTPRPSPTDPADATPGYERHVARQIIDGVPLEDIAVLVPALDPLAGLVAERLARLPWLATADTEPNGASADGRLPVHVAGGLPLTGTAAGARALAVVRALRTSLAGDALAQVPPALRTASPDGRHLSHGAAMDVVWTRWKRFSRGDRSDPTPLRDRLRGPLDRWMAPRLVRLFPVVVALSESVKARAPQEDHRRLGEDQRPSSWPRIRVTKHSPYLSLATSLRT